MDNAPQYIRVGNLVTDLRTFQTVPYANENDAIEALKAYPDKIHQSMVFNSKDHRRRVLWRMHQTFNKLRR